MRKALFITVASLLASSMGHALGADLPIGAPAIAAVPVFSWSGCYLGGHGGMGLANKTFTDPVQLAQDSVIGPGTTTGTTTTPVNVDGGLVGGQIGCDYQFAPNWVTGVEGAASGMNLRGSTSVALPMGNPGDQATVTAQTSFIPSVTGRLGYTFYRLLLYGRGGVAWASDKYNINGMVTGLGFGFQGLVLRTGWTAGAGAEWVFSRSWSANVEYDYYSFGTSNILMSDSINGFSGTVNVKQNVQVVKAGLNFHVWAW